MLADGGGALGGGGGGETVDTNTQQSTMEITSFFNLVEKDGPYIC